jgi:hypothetical protein
MRTIVIALATFTLTSQPLIAQGRDPNAGAEVRGVVRPADPPNLARVPASHHPDHGGPWVMWKGTPYEHVMIPIAVK